MNAVNHAPRKRKNTKKEEEEICLRVKYVRLTDLHLGVSREITFMLHHKPAYGQCRFVSLFKKRKEKFSYPAGAPGIETDDAKPSFIFYPSQNVAGCEGDLQNRERE